MCIVRRFNKCYSKYGTHDQCLTWLHLYLLYKPVLNSTHMINIIQVTRFKALLLYMVNMLYNKMWHMYYVVYCNGIPYFLELVHTSLLGFNRTFTMTYLSIYISKS